MPTISQNQIFFQFRKTLTFFTIFSSLGIEANIKKVFHDYDEIVAYTKYPVAHDTFLTSKYNGLIHVILPKEHTFTFSVLTTQEGSHSILLGNSPFWCSVIVPMIMRSDFLRDELNHPFP